MLKKLKTEDFDAVYNITKESFPPDERRPYEKQKALFEKPTFSIYGIKKCGILQAFITVHDLGIIVFAEHFAVNPEFRNMGIGSSVLSELKLLYGKQICLEVETPETDIAKRRIAFYERNGFYLNSYHYIQPPLSVGQNPVELKIMSTDQKLTAKEFEKTKRLIYKVAYDQPDFDCFKDH